MAGVDEVGGSARHRAPVAARSRVHRRGAARWFVPLLLLAVLAVVVSPSGTTQARWQDSAAVELPTLHADSLEITVAGRTSAGFTVTNTSSRAVLEWKVSSVRIDLPDAGSPEGRGDDGARHGGKGQGWLNGTMPFAVHAGRATAGGECTGSVVARGRFRPDVRLTELDDAAASRLGPAETAAVCVELNNPNVHRWMAENGVDVTLSVLAWSGSGGWTAAAEAAAPYRAADAEQEWPSWFHWIWSLLRAWIGDLWAAWQQFWAQYGPEIGGSERQACADIAGAGVCPSETARAAGAVTEEAGAAGVTPQQPGEAVATHVPGADGAAGPASGGTAPEGELSSAVAPNTEVGAVGADGTDVAEENQASRRATS